MLSLSRMLILTGALCSFSNAFSQQSNLLIQDYLAKEQVNLGLTSSDIQNWKISDQHVSAQTGITHIYVSQSFNGIEITEGTATFIVSNGEAILTGNRLISDISSKINLTTPILSQEEAIFFAASELKLSPPTAIREIEKRDEFTRVYNVESLSQESIPVQLVYGLSDKNELHLSWELNIYEHSSDHWWNVKIDAQTGALISQIDWVVSCTYGDHTHTKGETCAEPAFEETAIFPAPPPGTDQYNVFEIPTESPNHGPATLVVGPSDATASPYGWHDDDGAPGVEYTWTQGNNVRATEDMNDNNGTGFMPDGGPTQDFNFPININQPADQYLSPAITNLFYMNNIMHDVWYHYGFDEASGNFQENNYGSGGAGSDYVRAEAQDGGGTNNANFATPDDGSNPRMQMYLWSPSGGAPDLLTVNSPSTLASGYSSVESLFGAPVPSVPITGDLVLYEDNIGDTHDACDVPTVPGSLAGQIVFIRRGTCPFTDKVQRAQDAGAIAVVLANDVTGAPFAMTGTSATITIPSIMVSEGVGVIFVDSITAGVTLNVTIVNGGPFELDGDFDNGIIAHEYGHGISNRLTGGPSNSGCLSNDEQMGEGWSDWFGLMLTIEPGDLSTDGRGIGTFASGEPTTGGGIRPAPYSTNPGVNAYTYSATNNASISQPHGIGFVWCTMLWDLNWALIDEYGYDTDLYTGTGGNNIAMNLVMTGLKLQPCGPGFVDGRDAILQADQLLYNGVNECLIWTVFANRGLGYSADQGSADNRSDQTQAFDMPPPIEPLTTVSVCGDYLWAVDGQTYSATGIYMASLGGIGCADSAVLDLTIITGLNTAIIQNGTVLTASQPGLTYQWVDCDNNYAPVVGSTNQSFDPFVDGNYAVIISGSGCVDTSVCTIILITASIVDNDFGSSLEVYPNPTDGMVTIDLGEVQESLEVVVLDITGRVISNHNVAGVSEFELEIKGETGMYFIELHSKSGKHAQIKVQKTK
ncbi:MAG: extracellular elastinolytic metalloproteinase [Flavobacteriaceae bacterium]|jgi:extracellular elastinolytic metalloproteinase